MSRAKLGFSRPRWKVERLIRIVLELLGTLPSKYGSRLEGRDSLPHLINRRFLLRWRPLAPRCWCHSSAADFPTSTRPTLRQLSYGP